MRQPQVTALLHFLLALLLVGPVALGGVRLLTGAAFLVEFLTEGRVPALSAVSAPSRRQPMLAAGPAVDRYRAPALLSPVPAVLVHGFAPDGKDDPRAGQAARLLAQTGFDVAVPSIPGLMQGRLRPEDIRPVVDTAAALARDRGRSVALIGVSVGAGPALLAAAEPRLRDSVAMVVSLGGYASATELLRYFLTGYYQWGEAHGHVEHDPELVKHFVSANADLLEQRTRTELLSRDRARVDGVLAAPPPRLRGVLEALSPERVAADIPARLLLIHGRGDRAVPYTETLRLAAARPARTTVLLLGLFEHVEGAARRIRLTDLADLLTLWMGVYALQSTR
ncbi:MAG TPA: alpha/beta fold hydrolase [Methylomirabilota bacterium]|nr:alpha/beta fold hydrolase [Methylomirabilota bacterium]